MPREEIRIQIAVKVYDLKNKLLGTFASEEDARQWIRLQAQNVDVGEVGQFHIAYAPVVTYKQFTETIH